jgi:hypothetical protein
MVSYLVVLVCFVGLCSFWALFQLWLSKYQTDEEQNAKNSCQGCEEPCGKEMLFRPGP